MTLTASLFFDSISKFLIPYASSPNMKFSALSPNTSTTPCGFGAEQAKSLYHMYQAPQYVWLDFRGEAIGAHLRKGVHFVQF